MDHSNIINDLLKWIECNLESPLKLNDVATRAGYSKWHLQRIFKSITGQTLGNYIRARRLTLAALMLRLTNRPLLDIVMHYEFKSQQSFTRAFKIQFGNTPASYRNSPNWDFSGMTPSLELSLYISPIPEYIILPHIKTYGITLHDSCEFNTFQSCCQKIRFSAKSLFNKKFGHIQPITYGICQSKRSKLKENEIEITYSSTTIKQFLSPNIYSICEIDIKSGLYVRFPYHGDSKNFQDFIMIIYHYTLPKMKLIRRNTDDIECYYNVFDHAEECVCDKIHCDYLIPVEKKI
ncbi:helix-turn-helix domain-containing protein [Citrobacter amalonaticus]